MTSGRLCLSSQRSLRVIDRVLGNADDDPGGTGGDPTGEFGAGVQASTEDGRYLNLNVGGRGQAQSFGDPCIWPTEPGDATCGADEDLQDDYDPGGPPPGVEGFIPDEVEGTDT